MSLDTDALEVLSALVLAGADEDAVCRVLRATHADVRKGAALLGLSFHPLAKLEWCDRCCKPRSEIDPQTGWCVPCTTSARIEHQRILDDEEEARLREEAVRDVKAVDKERQRTRDEIDPDRPRRHPPFRLCEKWEFSVCEECGGEAFGTSPRKRARTAEDEAIDAIIAEQADALDALGAG